ncbi:3'-5' exonuclease domain-containing protein [Cryptosporidium felis]|nr:3'-5' exonuclease domain-containing protein [Cryptosporidium felis]
MVIIRPQELPEEGEIPGFEDGMVAAKSTEFSEKDLSSGSEKKEGNETFNGFESYFTNIIHASNCENCKGLIKRASAILNSSERSQMVQSLWTNLINNFSFKFVPRLFLKPYSCVSESSRFHSLTCELINQSILRDKEDRLGPSEGNGEGFQKLGTLVCLHPQVYSTKIENLSPFGSHHTGLRVIDDLVEIMHFKELVLCQKFVDKNKFEVGNLYRHELRSLNWGVNGTIYHTGDDYEADDYFGSVESVPSAHFNLSYSPPKLYLPLSNTPLTFISELDELKRMIDEILISMESYYSESTANERSDPFLLAIDVEHHSNQSFKGFVSLIQLSTRNHDYIIDPFNIFGSLHILNDLTANPKILKILHGSDYDVIWLQRDFSVYIVNMFDTGQAARVLNTPGGFSLKNLLGIYCSLEVDKKFQLADWRERPLTSDMIEYARGDTHYLLYIYDIMKNLLFLHAHKKQGSSVLVSDAFLEVEDNSIRIDRSILERFDFGDSNGTSELKAINLSSLDPAALLTVLHNSRQICLKEYYEKPIDIWNLCFGVRTKLPKSCFKTSVDTAIITLLSFLLFLWRETLARILDVNVNYVLKETMIIRLCQKQPMNNIELLGLYPSIPTNLKRHSDCILNVVTLVKDYVTSKSENEIFDFNSYISHIYSNISVGNTTSMDSAKNQVNCNQKIVSNFGKQFEDQKQSQTVQACGSMNIEDSKGFNNTLESEKTDGGTFQEMSTPVKTNRKPVLIKRSTPNSNEDKFVKNLFGPKSSTLNDKNKRIEEDASNEIIKDIDNTLIGLVSGVNSISSSQIAKAESLENETENKSPSSKKEAHRGGDREITFEEYYSKKTKYEALDDGDFTPLLSLKEKYSESGSSLDSKKKNCKTKQKKIKNREEKSDVKSESFSIKTPRLPLNSDLSDIIHENSKILPASFTCELTLPSFIKNFQQTSSNMKKPKKFVESMKAKKWHKR